MSGEERLREVSRARLERNIVDAHLLPNQTIDLLLEGKEVRRQRERAKAESETERQREGQK
jgi:hypothetical protein